MDSRTIRSHSGFGLRASDFGIAIVVGCALLLSSIAARAAFVYETPAEFLTSGDFNGDGIPDVLVLDRLTGNARVAYQSPAGALTWPAPRVSGIENVTGVGIGKLFSTNHDAIAATAPDFNRIALLDVSNSVPLIILPGLTATNGLIAAWDFLSLPATTISTATPATIPAAFGVGTLDISAFGLGSPQGSNPERTSFTGTTLNVPLGSVDGNPGTALALANSSANGKSAIFIFSMAGFRDLVLSFATRGTGTGFNSGVWAWSTDGINYTTLPGVNTASTNAFFGTVAVNFTAATALNNAPTAYLRYTLSGATSAGGNNRIDNVQLNATPTEAGGIGPHGLAGLPAPFGTNAPLDRLLCASTQNPTPAARLSLLGLNAGTVVTASEYAETAPLEHVNPLPLASNLTFAVGVARGATNDAVHVWQFTNSPGVIAALSNLPPGSDYALGHFNGEEFPRFWFYVPGGTNVVIRTFATNGSSFVFGPATILNLTQAVERIYIVGTNHDQSAMLQFGDGIQGARLPGGSPSLAPKYNAGGGAAFTGVVPMDDGRFALLSAPTGTASSLTAQVMTFDGTNYAQISSSSLPAVTTPNTRATVWLFASEPFTNTAATLISSVSVPDWSSGVSGLPGALSVRAENDSGTTTGLGSPTTNNLGAPPAGTTYALSDQYREDVSFFTYASPRPADPVVITIAPPPGSYGGPIQISFIKQNPAHEVRYRIGTTANWSLYSAPFSLTNDTTIQFYGSIPGSTRGRIQFATYSLGKIAVPPEPLIPLPGSETNPPPAVNPNATRISANGTVIYGRRGTNTVPSIWAIHLDGSSDTRITTGLRPRVSRDGHYMSFLRENDPAANQFSLWVRDLATGQEVQMHSSSNRYVGHDWSPGNTNLVFDNNCFLWRIGLSGPATQLPLPSDCRQGAPSVNPLDGRLALQVIFPGSMGLYLTPADATSKANLNLPVLSPRWPAWSPDGQRIAIADDPNISPAIDAGRNLWVVKLGAQTNVYQITALPVGTDGFPNGAVWSPNGSKLVGAGRISGVNGLWSIPLAADGSACHCPPQRLPTSPGDDIDFAGSVVAASVSVTYTNLGLFIRLEPESLVVYWSTNHDGFVLQSALALPAGFSWSPVSGPYFRAGPFFEHRRPRSELIHRTFFRLAYPGVLVLTPTEPQLGFQFEGSAIVLTWPPNYVGYILEAATNLSPPVLWSPLPGPYLNSNGFIEYRRTLPAAPQEFFRLRGP